MTAPLMHFALPRSEKCGLGHVKVSAIGAWPRERCRLAATGSNDCSYAPSGALSVFDAVPRLKPWAKFQGPCRGCGAGAAFAAQGVFEFL